MADSRQIPFDFGPEHTRKKATTQRLQRNLNPSGTRPTKPPPQSTYGGRGATPPKPPQLDLFDQPKPSGGGTPPPSGGGAAESVRISAGTGSAGNATGTPNVAENMRAQAEAARRYNTSTSGTAASVGENIKPNTGSTEKPTFKARAGKAANAAGTAAKNAAKKAVGYPGRAARATAGAVGRTVVGTAKMVGKMAGPAAKVAKGAGLGLGTIDTAMRVVDSPAARDLVTGDAERNRVLRSQVETQFERDRVTPAMRQADSLDPIDTSARDAERIARVRANEERRLSLEPGLRQNTFPLAVGTAVDALNSLVGLPTAKDRYGGDTEFTGYSYFPLEHIGQRIGTTLADLTNRQTPLPETGGAGTRAGKNIAALDAAPAQALAERISRANTGIDRMVAGIPKTGPAGFGWDSNPANLEPGSGFIRRSDGSITRILPRQGAAQQQPEKVSRQTADGGMPLGYTGHPAGAFAAAMAGAAANRMARTQELYERGREAGALGPNAVATANAFTDRIRAGTERIEATGKQRKEDREAGNARQQLIQDAASDDPVTSEAALDRAIQGAESGAQPDIDAINAISARILQRMGADWSLWAQLPWTGGRSPRQALSDWVDDDRNYSTLGAAMANVEIEEGGDRRIRLRNPDPNKTSARELGSMDDLSEKQQQAIYMAVRAAKEKAGMQ